MVKSEDYFTASDFGRHRIFKTLMDERDNVIKFSKQLLLETGMSEKEALAQIFRALHGKSGQGHMVKAPSPYQL